MEKIRIARIESKDSLKMCSALLAQVYNAEPWNDNWTEEKAFEKLDCFFSSPRFLGFMAFEGDSLLGCCVGNIEPYFAGDYFYLKEMFVSVHSQRNGVGSQLMLSLKNYLETIGIKTIILFTSSQYFPYNFYCKANFNIMEGMCMMHYGQTE